MMGGILTASADRGTTVTGMRNAMAAAAQGVGATPLFADVFASTIDDGNPAGSRTATKPASATIATKPSPTLTLTLTDALDAFKKEAQMTPRERIRRDVLKESRLTEESLAAMEPKDRDAAEQKIKAEVDRRLAAVEEEARRKGKTIGLAAAL